MVIAADALSARWRRFDAALAAVREAHTARDAAPMVDAVAGALEALYGLWEAWRLEAGLTFAAQNTAAEVDDQGRTTAALVYARGGQTHRLIDFGEMVPGAVFGQAVFGAAFFGFAWRWQAFADPRWAPRDAWYAALVAGAPVLDPLDSAGRWLRRRPELAPPP